MKIAMSRGFCLFCETFHRNVIFHAFYERYVNVTHFFLFQQQYPLNDFDGKQTPMCIKSRRRREKVPAENGRNFDTQKWGQKSNSKHRPLTDKCLLVRGTPLRPRNGFCLRQNNQY